MIVQERFEDYVNVYVDGYVFSANDKERSWGFGDGHDDEDRRAAEASRRGMTVEAFMEYYRSICNAAAGWDDPVWKFRYNVVALTGIGLNMLQEMMDRVEEAIVRNKASQDRAKCQELLKRYVSLGMIRMNGLTVRKYIYKAGGDGRGRIVYQMDELTPSEIEALIPVAVLAKAVHRQK